MQIKSLARLSTLLLPLFLAAPVLAQGLAPPPGGFGPDTFLLDAGNGNLEGVQKALNGGKNPNEVDKLDATSALIAAAKGNHVNVMEVLIRDRALVDLKDKSGNTALNWAAERGNVDAVKVLLDAGADPNTVDRSGNSPLIKAAKIGNVDILKLLVATKKVDLKRGDFTGMTASDWAERNRQTAAVRYLRDAGG
ncbi:MAG: ankyrin repeat domain-containing protein [Alphaproteobacteria bacterium]